MAMATTKSTSSNPPKELPDAVSSQLKDSLPSRFQFVDVGSRSPSEIRRNQRVIRSAAMKTFRRNQQLQGKKINGKDASKNLQGKDRQAIAVSRGGLNVHDLNSTSDVSYVSRDDLSVAVLAETSSNSKVRGNLKQRKLENLKTQGKGEIRSEGPYHVSLGSPITLLGGARADPFRRFPMKATGSHVDEIINHSVKTLWPALIPSSEATSRTLASLWLEKMTERPVLMHALLFGGAVHLDVLRSTRGLPKNPVRLYHKVETMRLLKESLNDPEKIPLDDIILAVLCLAANEVETATSNMREISPSPFNGPLSSVQWLDVYGRIAHVPAHIAGMRCLVARRGGLDKIELDGLAETLFFSDVLGATQNLSKPHWPLLSRAAVYSPRSSDLDFSAQAVAEGFDILVPHGITEETASVLKAMAELTSVIEFHCRGIRPIHDMALFANQKNCAQYRLMSLRSAVELKPGEVSSASLYEAIRLTAIIYSTAVTFPIPPVQGLFHKITHWLKAVVEESELDPCWQLYPKTLLWILILGGIAAFNTPERVWYVQKLKAISSLLECSLWEAVVDELRSYLWLDSACEAGGRVLWEEVVGSDLSTKTTNSACFDTRSNSVTADAEHEMTKVYRDLD